jgi:hypothetical protein
LQTSGAMRRENVELWLASSTVIPGLRQRIPQ